MLLALLACVDYLRVSPFKISELKIPNRIAPSSRSLEGVLQSFRFDKGCLLRRYGPFVFQAFAEASFDLA